MRFFGLQRKILVNLRPKFDLFSSSASPSCKTTVLLKNLASSVTLDKLSVLMKDIDINHRKVEIEPGCSIHTIGEAEALVVAETIKTSLCLGAKINSTTMPSLLLQNIPPGLTSDSIRSKFKDFDPKYVRIVGSDIIQSIFSSPSHALNAADIISKLQFKGEILTSHVVKVSADAFALQVSGWSTSFTTEDVQIFLSESLSNSFPNLNWSFKPGPPSACIVRIPSSGIENTDRILEDLKKNATLPNLSISTIALKKPSLFFRKIPDSCDPQDLKNLVAENGASYFHRSMKSRDLLGDVAVAYFPTEEAALNAMKNMKNVMLDGKKKMSISFREMSEPALKIHNLPGNASLEDVQGMLASYFVKPTRVQLLNSGVSANGDIDALVVFGSAKDAQQASVIFRNKHVGNGRILTCSDSPINDIGVVYTFAGASIQDTDKVIYDVSSALKSVPTLQDRAISMSLKSNIDAFVVFETILKADSAQNSFYNGVVNVSQDVGAVRSSDNNDAIGVKKGSLIVSKLTVYPSFAIEATGLDPSMPASIVEDTIRAKLLEGISMMKIDRTAIVKFKKSNDVVPGMKMLKKCILDGKSLSVEKYRTLSGAAEDADYDQVGTYEKFDQFATRNVLADFMHTDPSTRYQIARNSFERSLFEAQESNDVSRLINSSASPAIRTEAQSILKSRNPDINRLFELYVQNEDMIRFSHDFDELRSVLGPAELGDPFNWSQFSIQTLDHISKYEAVLAKEKAQQEAVKRAEVDRRFEQFKEETKGDFDTLKLELMKIEHEALETGKGLRVSPDLRDTIDRIVPATDKLDRKVHKEMKQQLIELSAAANTGTSMSNRVQKILRGLTGLDKETDENDFADVSSSNDDLDFTSGLDDSGTSDENPAMRHGAKDIKVEGPDGNEETVVLEDVNELKDRDGHLWSGVILDTDTVSKTMPGNRMMSFRCLVAVGNLKGSAGFGMGKGKTQADALKYAFRAALANLTHIDLYDNFGLAHDVYGKHNSCHAYIRATPENRLMVASPFARAILNRFGISSASCKLVGRRNPYSQVRAIFNAIAKHENIDEFAKDRGQRYLTLRWLYQNKI